MIIGIRLIPQIPVANIEFIPFHKFFFPFTAFTSGIGRVRIGQAIGVVFQVKFEKE